MSKTGGESAQPDSDVVIVVSDTGGEKTPREQTVELQYRKRRWADLSRRLEDEDCAFEGDLKARGLDPLLSQYEAVKVLLNRKLVADGEKEIGPDSTRVSRDFSYLIFSWGFYPFFFYSPVSLLIILS